MTQNAFKQLEEVLDPNIIRFKLISTSLYLSAFEFLKDIIIERVKSFYNFGFDENGPIIDSKYESTVLVRNKSHLYASLDWLKEHGAINEEDLVNFDNIKICRNKIAHELPKLFTSEICFDYLDMFLKLKELLRKIEIWWILNIEIPTNPNFDNLEVNENEISPGSVVVIEMMTNIALDTEKLPPQTHSNTPSSV